MFKHILIPTDGSRLAAKGVRAGVRLAKVLRAKVTGLHVSFPYVPPFYGEAALYYFPGLSPAEFKRITAKQTSKALKPLVGGARKARVACRTRSVVAGQPWQAILQAARSAGCDAIVMASHGRSGVGSLILGSQTTQVLARSKIPVLVVR